LLETDWRGLFAAVPTLFDKSGGLDEPGLAAHVRRLAMAGVESFTVLGAAGESAALTLEERRRVLDVTRDAAGDHAVLLAGVVGPDVEAGRVQAEQAATAGCDGLLVPPAPFLGADEGEAVAFVRTVARNVALPVMLDSSAEASNAPATPAMLDALAEENMLVAVAQATGSTEFLGRVRDALDDRFSLFWNADETAPEALAAAADGWVSLAVNIFPEECVALYRHGHAGDFTVVRRLGAWMGPVLRLCAGPRRTPAVKLAMQIMEHGNETMRSPLIPLSGSRRAALEAAMAQAIDTRLTFPF